MALSFAALSDSLSTLVASFAPSVCAVRIGPDRHITGLLTPGRTILVPNRLLPPRDAYAALCSDGSTLTVRRPLRDVVSDIAAIEVDSTASGATTPGALPPTASLGRAKQLGIVIPPVGGLLVMLSASPEGAPRARLAMVNHLAKTQFGAAPALDAANIEPGTILVDGNGRLAGIVTTDAQDRTAVIPVACLQRFLGSATIVGGHALTQKIAAQQPPYPMPAAGSAAAASSLMQPATVSARPQRGWLGVLLQPMTVPKALVQNAGQSSGRMVVSVVEDGPADLAGLKVGDVLLTLNGQGITGGGFLRDFLTAERIGAAVEVTLLRNGTVMTATLTIAGQPDH